MSQRNWILALALVIILAGGAAFWFSGQPDEAPPATTPEETAPPNVVGRNVSFIVTEGARKKWRLLAQKADYYQDQSGAELEGISGEFYDKSGKPVLTFTAPKGTYKNRQNQVVLTGGVVAQSLGKEQHKLLAPTLRWNAKSDEMLAEGGVTLSFGQGTSKAARCRFTLDFSVVSLEGDAVSTLSPP